MSNWGWILIFITNSTIPPSHDTRLFDTLDSLVYLIYSWVHHGIDQNKQENCPTESTFSISHLNIPQTTKDVAIMPHALSMPAPGFQAIILCGPGSSFPTFTANPDKNPKALIPIANRPMVWYPIDFCYRMGITGESNFIYCV